MKYILFEKALGLSDSWFIKEMDFNVEEKHLVIFVDFKRGATFFYQDENVSGSFKAYDTVEKTYRHLNFFQHECCLHARIPRVDIGKSGESKPKLIKVPWAGKEDDFTLLFDALLLELCEAITAKAIKNYWSGVINWYKNKKNNGILEGLNSVIQAVKSRARGYRTYGCFRIIAYLVTANFDFSKYKQQRFYPLKS